MLDSCTISDWIASQSDVIIAMDQLAPLVKNPALSRSLFSERRPITASGQRRPMYSAPLPANVCDASDATVQGKSPYYPKVALWDINGILLTQLRGMVNIPCGRTSCAAIAVSPAVTANRTPKSSNNP